MKSGMYKMAMFLGMAAAFSGENLYGSPERKVGMKQKQLTDDDRKRIQNSYNNQFHKYIICGVEIIARSKKDAKRIYSKTKGK